MDKDKPQYYILRVRDDLPETHWLYQYRDTNIEAYDGNDKYYTCSWSNQTSLLKTDFKSATPIERFEPELLGFDDRDKNYHEQYRGRRYKQFRYHSDCIGFGDLYLVELEKIQSGAFEPSLRNIWLIQIKRYEHDKTQPLKELIEDCTHKQGELCVKVDIKLDSHQIAKTFFNNIGGYSTPSKFMTWLEKVWN